MNNDHKFDCPPSEAEKLQYLVQWQMAQLCHSAPQSQTSMCKASTAAKSKVLPSLT